MEAFAAPIVPGKEDMWIAWTQELKGVKLEQAKDQNRRFNLTKHAAWLQQTPKGAFVIVVYDGPGAAEFMGNLAQSENQFDVWFKERVAEAHGIDFAQPPPPMPELVLDLGQ